MIDDSKLLLRVAREGKEITIPRGWYNTDDSEFTLAILEDGTKAIYQSVKQIIWDCDKKPLDIEEEKKT